MKKWELAKAKKHLAEIIDTVVQGEIQGIIAPGGDTVYLIPGEKYNQIENRENKVTISRQPSTSLIIPAI